MGAWIVLVSVLAAQSSTAQPAPPRFGCSAPEYRQFDFWIGDWEVVNPKGEVAGTNVITREFDGCVIQERWRGARGMIGSSFNSYDPTTRKWHQTWVDNTGTLLTLDGEFGAGAMRLEGRGAGPSGATRNRITWRPLDGGRVRQTWEISKDEGKTWSVIFAGTYRKRSDASKSSQHK
jgi:hypothetical protein